MTDNEQATANAEALLDGYFGRIIGMGIDETERYFGQFAVMTGRSVGSRNRVYREKLISVCTEVADPAVEAGDPALTLYNAMQEHSGCYVVSNGKQTNDILNYCAARKTMDEALHDWTFEPEKADFTPRISGIVRFTGPAFFELNILRRSEDRGQPGPGDRHPASWTWDVIERGLMRCLRTYEHDGNPLPAYRGDYFLLPLLGDVHEAARHLWSWLNPKYRAGVVVKFIDRETGESHISIINEFDERKKAAA